MKETRGIVTSKGQLVIPARLRSMLHVGRGTRVRFERIQGGIAIYPEVGQDIERFRGILAGSRLPAEPARDRDRDLR